MEIDPEKARTLLKRWWTDSLESPGEFANAVLRDLEKNAQPDPEVWEECNDPATWAFMTGAATMRDGQIERIMWPREVMHRKCQHSVHVRENRVSEFGPRGFWIKGKVGDVRVSNESG